MPKQTGLRHLLRELYTRPAETEVLVTDLEYHQRWYPKNYEEIARRDDLLGVPGCPVPPIERREPATREAAASTKNRIADRTVLRMVDAPLRGDETATPLPAATFLLGAGADAEALAATLAARGVKIKRLPAESAEAACAALEAAYAQTPIRSLILATAREPEAAHLDDRASIERRVERGVYLPYRVARKWFQLVDKNPAAGPATIVALTSLGGSCGFSGAVGAPEGGALAGLLKSIFVEDFRYDHGRYRVKVLDFPPHEPPAQVAWAVCGELAAGRPEVEVAWSGGQRRIVATVRQGVESLPLGELPRGGVWVVTGGARGITAATALALGRRYGLKLHLLGKSPPPETNSPWRNCTEEQLKAIKAEVVRKATEQGRSPNDEWERVKKDREIHESLEKFAAAGVSATYHACDMANWDDVERVLNEVRAQSGPIEGIVHGAGYAKSFRFGTGNAAKLSATIDPKVGGTLALMHLTANDPLRYFVGFGSLSGRFGGNGLSDYAAANDMLAKLCGWFRSRRPECHTTCFHWQTWDQVGMALLADGVGITKNAFKMNFIPPEEGVAHLIDELRAGASESEVLITDAFFQRQFYPYEFEVPAQRAASVAAPAPQPPVHAPTTTGAPLVAEWQAAAGGGAARIVFDPVADPFLDQHRLKNRPFLPGVVGVESLAEAACCARGGQVVRELCDVRIVNGMSFSSDSPLEARVEVSPVEGGLSCRLLTEQRDRQGRMVNAARLHVEGLAPAAAEPIQADPPGRPMGWIPNTYLEDGLIFHGPQFRCLKAWCHQYDGGWGQIVATGVEELAGKRGSEGWILPLAVLDACVVTCGSFLFMQFGGVVEVPYEFERLRWSRLPRAGEACVVRLFFRGRDERHSRFDFTLYGEGDEPILQAIGFRTIRVGAGGR
jgi:NAD(P)-dependent dehydrogenase (short-subunit alcohol dehydrogenase family)